jgi:TRAP-type C4-dicarboxylate transport system substrate-binding protein
MIARSTALLCLVIAVVSHAAEPLKVGSLAPQKSPWGSVLSAWGKAADKKTSGRVQLAFFWNGAQGDEAAQVSKMKAGQLDGAVLSGVGLALIDSDVNALQLPGLYEGWAQLDTVRAALTPRFEKSFADKGFVLVGWGDIGLDRWMSKGAPLATPADFKALRPWVWRDDALLPSVMQAAGVTATQSAVPEVVPLLSTGKVNALSVSALAAEQLQWASALDHVSASIVAPNIGALVIRKASLDALPEADRATLLELGKQTSTMLTARIRSEDEKAFERLKGKMTVVTWSPEQAAAWKANFQDARSRIVKAGIVSQAVMGEVEKALK